MATYTFTGPTTGLQQVASTNFTVTMDATAITGSVIVTPNDGGKGGAFSPASLTFTTASQSHTFTYLPLNTGAVTISTTNNKGYTNPAALTYTVTMNPNVVVNELLWAWERNQGYRFPFYEITRDGGVSDADARTLDSSYEAYRTLRAARPTEVPILPSVGPFKIYDLYGRTGAGQTPADEDVFSPSDRGVDQTGDGPRGTTNDSPETDRGIDSTGK